MLEREVSPSLVDPVRDLLAADATPWLTGRMQQFVDRRTARLRSEVFLHKFTGWPRTGFLEACFPGSVVIEVDDEQGHAAGRFAVTTAGGAATVTPTDDEPDVCLTAETLGSLYLGVAPVRRLHRAGRLDGTDEAVRRFAAMADLSEPAYSLTGF